MLVTRDGRVFSWGDGTNLHSLIPVAMDLPRARCAVDACGSYYYHCALLADGGVVCEGDARFLSPPGASGARGLERQVAPATGVPITDAVGIGCMSNADVRASRARARRIAT